MSVVDDPSMTEFYGQCARDPHPEKNGSCPPKPVGGPLLQMRGLGLHEASIGDGKSKHSILQLVMWLGQSRALG